jgi:hypothetical protein
VHVMDVCVQKRAGLRGPAATQAAETAAVKHNEHNFTSAAGGLLGKLSQKKRMERLLEEHILSHLLDPQTSRWLSLCLSRNDMNRDACKYNRSAVGT